MSEKCAIIIACILKSGGENVMERQNRENSTPEESAKTELSPVTGLLYNRYFFKHVREYIHQHEADMLCMVAIDIEHFRMFNKLYGRLEGNRLLEHIAEVLTQETREYGGVAGYLGGDNFAVVMNRDLEHVRELKHRIVDGIRRWNNTLGFLPAIGIYEIDEPELAPETMYDKASMAASKILGNYSRRICTYSADMENTLEQEIQLLSEIQQSLEKEEFIFYVQPQCNISTGKIVGGESLVRWRHGTKGLISPGMFIPVLEKNGFIADLDRYIWKKVCQWLRSCLDRGLRPVPISINISRVDIFSMDVAEYLKELMEQYQLPQKLLKVEITESAYAESNDKIIRTVKQLRDADFLVMMDDFGSGYSSLNMLKSVSVDVLKLDMRFLEIKEKEEEKGMGILQSVINMAKQMRMPIVVEGVENGKQEDFLRRLGCRYTQGYYYYKPLPVEEFEKLLCDEKNLDFDGFWYKQVEPFRVKEFLDDNLFSDVMINNIIGPVAFYDIYENRMEITRVNEQYYQLTGISRDDQKDYKKCFWNHVRDDDRQLLLSIFEQAYNNPVEGAEGYAHFVREDSTVLWVHVRIYFMREKDGHKLFYGAITDMTAFREKLENRRLTEQRLDDVGGEQLDRMEKYYGDMPCGYAVARILLDKEKKPADYEIAYGNNKLRHMCGGDIERLRYMIQKSFGDKKAEMIDKAYQAAYLGETVEYYVHSSLTGSYLHFTFYQYEYGYAGCILQDVTAPHVYEDVLKTIVSCYREVYFLHLKDSYLRMIYPDENHLLERGSYEEIINRHIETGRILPYDAAEVRSRMSAEGIRDALRDKDTAEYKYRRSVDGIGEEWCLTTISVSERENGEPKTAIATIRSIEALMREREDDRNRSMAQALSRMSDGFFIYRATENEKILYANPTVLRIYGCQTMDEFRELVDNSFRGMVHPEDRNRVEWEIQQQVQQSDKSMEFIIYRIIRKDGEIRWIDDCGHMEDEDSGADAKLFYVFISDVTDSISEEKRNKLLRLNQYYNKTVEK